MDAQTDAGGDFGERAAEFLHGRQALAQREKLYRDLMTYSQALICTHDLQGTLLTANPAAAALVGQPLAALPGCQLAQFFPDRYQSRVAHYLAHIVQYGS